MRKLDNLHVLQHLHNSGAYVTVQFCIGCVSVTKPSILCLKAGFFSISIFDIQLLAFLIIVKKEYWSSI